MEQGRLHLDVGSGLTITRNHEKLNRKKMNVYLLEWIGEIGKFLKRTTYRTSSCAVLLPTSYKLAGITKQHSEVFIRVESTPQLEGDVIWLNPNQLEISGILFDIKAKPRYTLGFITFNTKVHSCISQ
jgi:hypothetical protein